MERKRSPAHIRLEFPAMSAQKDDVHEILEVHFARIVEDLENHMQRKEAELAQDRRDFYTPQIEALEAKIQTAEDEFLRMEGEASASTTELNRKSAAINRLVQVSARLHQRVRNGWVCVRSLKAWAEIATDRLILIRAFKRIYILSRLKRAIFRRWIRKMYKRREERIHAEIKSRFEKQRRAQAAETNRVMGGLEEELQTARAELEEKQQRFLELQQRLRKAFMRGVVNLNLEAMDVFNGAQVMDLIQEVQGNEAEHFDEEAAINESDDEFFVEDDSVPISVIKHR
jgi:Mg2+ and Co2+ transporter CorA